MDMSTKTAAMGVVIGIAALYIYDKFVKGKF